MTIADKIRRAKTDYDAVYEAGYEKGKAEGSGGDSFYDEFWDIIQENGNRTDYADMFSGYAWTAETFKPKYPIKPTHAIRMFRLSKVTTNDYIKSIDFSRCGSMNSVFSESAVTELGVIDCSAAISGWGGAVQCFYACKSLKSIEKIIPPSAGLNFDSFRYCWALVDIVFEGEVASTTNLGESTLLSKASITSLINALSPTASGLTLTLSKTAVNTAFETSAGANDGSTSQAWLDLSGTKSNWTISLLDSN